MAAYWNVTGPPGRLSVSTPARCGGAMEPDCEVALLPCSASQSSSNAAGFTLVAAVLHTFAAVP